MLKSSATDGEILEYIDNWVALLEKEDYHTAFKFTKHIKRQGWTPEFIREVIKSYGDDESSPKVTLSNNGLSIDGAGNIEKATQRKEVTWFDETRGDVWYDLNINGYVSDLTATFDLQKTDTEIHIFLDDIHVM
jgi:hypothetical protein